MPYRKVKFANNEIYHIVLRRVGSDLLFKDKDDYYRGIFSIYEFNNTNPVEIWRRRRERIIEKNREKNVGGRASHNFTEDTRNKLVDVLAFCLMSNHIHLLVRQLKDDGIVKFMSKVGTGFGGYFNRKYGNKGHIFQDRFGVVHIKNETQLKVVFVYIHTNPLAIIESKWKEEGIKAPQKATKFLEKYKWSSYPDYLGAKNFPSVTERDFLIKTIGDFEECRRIVNDWVEYKGEIKEFADLALE